MRAPALAVLISTAALLAAAEARAQAIFTTAPQEVFNLKFERVRPTIAGPAPIIPPPPPAATRAPSVSQHVAALAPEREPATHAGVTLRHLTSNVRGFRLAGEIGASEWPIYVTARQAARPSKFQLGYVAAVSVMPETSTLTLSVNDRVIGETPIQAVHAVKTVVFDVPEGLLLPGFNSVRISTNQRHRVDCSLSATYELWTQIDPIRTGLVLEQSVAGVDDVADLGALLPDEQGALPIRAALSSHPSPFEIERMLRAAQSIALAGRFEQPVVEVGPLAAGAFGVNLLVGTAAELAKETNFDVLVGVDSPRVLALPATPRRRTTVIVTGATWRQVDEAMNRLAAAASRKGSPQGLRAAAAFPGFRLEGGRRVKLRDIGLASEEFAGRLFRVAFNIVLPPDFYPADYGRAQLRLAGGYAPGLGPEARVVVRVDGRTAVSLALPKPAGDVFEDKLLPLPLGFLRPGLNRIEIEAHVPTSDDLDCDPLSGMRAAARFLFLDSTEIELPALARIARMPDLAVTANGGFPFAGAAGRPKLFLPKLDEKTIGAAATIVAHLAIAAGRPIAFEVVGAQPGARKGPTLAVAPLDALDPALMRRLDIPADELRAAWRSQLAEEPKAPADGALSAADVAHRQRVALQRNFPMACHASKPVDAKILPEKSDGAAQAVRAEQPRSNGARDLLEEWDMKLRKRGRSGVDVLGLLRKASDWGVATAADAAAWIRAVGGRDADEERLASGRMRLAIGQSILGNSTEDVWTVVTAPSSAALAEAANCLVDPRVSRQISGRLAALDMAEAQIIATPAETARFIVTQPLSIGNVRLIAAGWLSLHSFAYVAALMVVAGLFAVSTRWLVRNLGRKTE